MASKRAQAWGCSGGLTGPRNQGKPFMGVLAAARRFKDFGNKRQSAWWRSLHLACPKLSNESHPLPQGPSSEFSSFPFSVEAGRRSQAVCLPTCWWLVSGRASPVATPMREDSVGPLWVSE